jgi:hypothetical protein
MALGLALAACKPQGSESSTTTPATAAEDAPASTEAPAAAASAASCADAGFDDFIKRFSAQIAVQKTSTADPLTMIRIDPAAQPEPAPVTREVALSEVAWPVIPDLDAARASKRDVLVSGEGDQREVLVRTPDTDDQQVYTFAAQPCWTLTKVDDQSL